MGLNEGAPPALLSGQYFLPLESFDAVRHLLENLPTDGLTKPYLASQTSQTQVILDAINSQLSVRVMRSYGTFVHGMAKVQQLESDLVFASILCRSARRQLAKVQGIMVIGGLQLLNCLRRRQLMTSLAQLLCRLTDFSVSVGMLESLLRPQSSGVASLPEAARCQARCEQFMWQLNALNVSKSLVSYFQAASEKLSASLRGTLLATCAEFSDVAYDSALSACIILGTVSDVVDNINFFFAEAIKACSKAAVSSHIVHAELIKNSELVHCVAEAELDHSKYKDVCARLPEEYLDSCLSHTLQALLAVLHSHHQMLDWLQTSHKVANDIVTAAENKMAEVREIYDGGSGNSFTACEREVLRTAHHDLDEVANTGSVARERVKCLGQVIAAVDQARVAVWNLMQRRVAVFVSAGAMLLLYRLCQPEVPRIPLVYSLLAKMRIDLNSVRFAFLSSADA